MYSCRACLSSEPHIRYVFREMMFGTREEFEYAQCSACATIQRVSIVPDEGKFYPADYYSFGSNSPKTFRSKFTVLRERKELLNDTIIGSILKRYRPRKIDEHLDILRCLKLKKETRVLDVGCGSGGLLQRLARAGLRDLTGADPFIEANTSSDGVRIFKCGLEDIPGQFDVIMFHHAFEHMADPEGTLLEVRRHLAPGGKCLIRIPTCSSAAWNKYGKDWVQLDAPRHTVIFSRDGFAVLAERTGFRVTDTIDDSSSFQFWGSEMYRRDIPLKSKRPEDIFSVDQLNAFQLQAKELNFQNEGDQAAFFIAPKRAD